uniref:Uncharacterized protein n=1 Tax=Ditylenchus dipsaci TaxID=166011 RepID=A0A915E399_9BILA
MSSSGVNVAISEDNTQTTTGEKVREWKPKFADVVGHQALAAFSANKRVGAEKLLADNIKHQLNSSLVFEPLPVTLSRVASLKGSNNNLEVIGSITNLQVEAPDTSRSSSNISKRRKSVRVVPNEQTNHTNVDQPDTIAVALNGTVSKLKTLLDATKTTTLKRDKRQSFKIYQRVNSISDG